MVFQLEALFAVGGLKDRVCNRDIIIRVMDQDDNLVKDVEDQEGLI